MLGLGYGGRKGEGQEMRSELGDQGWQKLEPVCR